MLKKMLGYACFAGTGLVGVQEKNVLPHRLFAGVAKKCLRSPAPAGQISRHVKRDDRDLQLFQNLRLQLHYLGSRWRAIRYDPS